MTKARDPLGKRALFSEGAAPETSPQKRKPGLFDMTVHCSSCDARTTLSATELIMHQFPLSAWVPWLKFSRFMRCPACGNLGWCAVSRAR